MESPGSLPWPGPEGTADAPERAALSRGGSSGRGGRRCVPTPREPPCLPERECMSLRNERGAAPEPPATAHALGLPLRPRSLRFR